MKRLIVAVAATLALMAGAAHAGEGCNYGSHAVAEQEKAPVMAAAEQMDAELLARLQEQEELEALEKLLDTPVVHN
ncbi:MAG: hypothetical protein HKN42_04010 [Granulosicoccus sp.]|nr:hypothetical protein [Granulosicoccus sp.]